MTSRLLVAVCACCLCSQLSSCQRQVKDPPKAARISSCQSSPSTDQPTSRLLAFNAPQNTFAVKKWQRDMPPEVVHVVTLNGATRVKLVISPDDADFRDLQTAYPTFSENVEERIVQDFEGHSFGTDRWGYLHNGERWRLVKFNTGDRAGYEPLPTAQADLLDQVVNSACLLTPDQIRTRYSNPMRIEVGGSGNRPIPDLIRRVSPIYPAEAAAKKVQGVVRLHVILDREGKVFQIGVVNGDPLLVSAAIEAVKQWSYKPQPDERYAGFYIDVEVKPQQN